MKNTKFSLKGIATVVLAVTLSACGGGGGSSATPSNSGGGTTTPTNTAPTISLGSSSASINENGTYTLEFTTSDKENDNVSVSVSGGASHLSTVINASSITFNSSDIDADTTSTFSIKASDGKASSTASFSLEVLNIDEPVDTTSIVLAENNLELSMQELRTVSFSLENGESIDSASFEANYDDGAFSNVQYVEGSGIQFQSRNKIGDFTISFSVKDVNGVEADPVELSVGVVEQKQNIEAPVLSFANAKDGRLYFEVESFQDVVIPFTIEDPDSDSFTCIPSDVFVTGDFYDFQYFPDCDTRELKVNTFNVIDSNTLVEFKLEVSDGKHRSNAVTIVFKLIEADNENAKIDFNYEKPFLKIEENTSKTLTYTIQDDGVTEVTFNEFQEWYGDSSNYTITHNADNKSFEIIPSANLKAADSFGVLLSFKDGGDYINHYLEVKITAPIGEIEERALALSEKYENAMASSREYNLLGQAYTDYLFSVGKVSYTDKEEYDAKFKSDSRDSLGIFAQYNNDIKDRVENGEFAKQPASLNYYIDYFNENLDQLLAAGVAIQSDLNTLASLDNALPSLTVTSSVVDLDDSHFSRLIGNSSYGEYVNDKFTFDTEYRFLNVISGKTNNAGFVN